MRSRAATGPGRWIAATPARPANATSHAVIASALVAGCELGCGPDPLREICLHTRDVLQCSRVMPPPRVPGPDRVPEITAPVRGAVAGDGVQPALGAVVVGAEDRAVVVGVERRVVAEPAADRALPVIRA